MPRRPSPARVLTLTLAIAVLSACSESYEPAPFTPTESPATAVAAATPSSTRTPATATPTATATATRTGPAGPTATPRPSAARPITTLVPAGGLTPDMRRSVEVVKSFFLAQIATPSADSIRTMRSLASPECVACAQDIAVIAERSMKKQHTVREVGDPAWGGILYSFRPSTGPGLITVRQQYRQPPLTLVGPDGTVIGRAGTETFTSLFVVEPSTGRITSRTAVE